MERRLLEAAQKGNIDELKDLIRSNALILEEMALEGAGHTPLHVACLAGHLDFVREFLKLKPKLAGKVNAGGFSPLHIAAARGDVETARELLRVGQSLCFVKGREGRIPLHYAVVNGELDVMKELLSASPESIEKTTAREETALHLAVKNNRFAAAVVLVEHLKQHNKEQVINWKDKKGDTVLHIAAATKNFEVVDFMLCGHALELGIVEVNALNKSGSTPLDVASGSDREIREILMRAGATHGQSNLPSSQIVQVDGDEDDIKGATGYQSVANPAVEDDHPPSPPQKDPNHGQESLGDVRSALLVVAAHALSKSGSTPLDASSRSDREIREILMRAGAQHGQSNLPSSQIVQVDCDNDDIKGATGYQPVANPAVKDDHPPSTPRKDPNHGQESLGDIRSALLVVAALIASATYQAVLQPPTFLKKVQIHTEKGLYAAYLSFMTGTTGRNLALLSFMSSNTFGFLISVQAIISLTHDLPLKLPLVLSTFAMVWTYLSCMVNVPSRSLLDENFSLVGASFIGTLAILIPVVLLLIQIKIARYLGKGIDFLSQINILCLSKVGQTHPNPTGARPHRSMPI